MAHSAPGASECSARRTRSKGTRRDHRTYKKQRHKARRHERSLQPIAYQKLHDQVPPLLPLRPPAPDGHTFSTDTLLANLVAHDSLTAHGMREHA